MKTFIPLVLLCALIYGCGTSQDKSGLPVIDLTQQYPKKDIVLQDIANVEYISLNAKDAPLIGQVQIGYISNDCYILYDSMHGDVFVLDQNGKARNHFNHKGNGSKEYMFASHLTFDPVADEIYILDANGSNGILVYTGEGIFVRHFPDLARQNIAEIYDFDDQTLIAYFAPSSADPDNLNHTDPYVFISKLKGTIESRVNLHFSQRLSNRIMIPLGDGAVAPILIATSESRKYGHNFVIADRSADTLYILSQNHVLTPILARTPSVFAQDPFVAWSVGLMTDQFICMGALEYNFEMLKRQFINNQPLGDLKSQDYLYFFKSHEIFIPHFINVDWPSKKASVEMNRVSVREKNMSARIIQADRLADALEKGELHGKLKEVAQTLSYDDNPVLMLLRYK
ncbi:MAG: 6-bladed beta-propeller [Bacteroidetes bacterium]|nr:6-bladed beta-propeller [Bacteroidota bacterium]